MHADSSNGFPRPTNHRRQDGHFESIPTHSWLNFRCNICAAVYYGDHEGKKIIGVPTVGREGDQKAGYAFNVVTEVLRERANLRSMATYKNILSVMYVDDKITFGSVEAV